MTNIGRPLAALSRIQRNKKQELQTFNRPPKKKTTLRWRTGKFFYFFHTGTETRCSKFIIPSNWLVVRTKSDHRLSKYWHFIFKKHDRSGYVKIIWCSVTATLHTLLNRQTYVQCVLIRQDTLQIRLIHYTHVINTLTISYSIVVNTLAVRYTSADVWLTYQ